MVVLLALATGVLFAAGIYLVLKRTVVQLIIGLALLGHAANLFLFSMGGIKSGSVPIIGAGSASSMVDPVPQALILTAIVIGFGMQAFVLILSYRAHEESGSDNLEEIESTDAV